MNGFKWHIVIAMVRKFALPALLGSAVLWLIHHNLQPWADVVCSISEALLISVEECK